MFAFAAPVGPRIVEPVRRVGASHIHAGRERRAGVASDRASRDLLQGDHVGAVRSYFRGDKVEPPFEMAKRGNVVEEIAGQQLEFSRAHGFGIPARLFVMPQRARASRLPPERRTDKKQTCASGLDFSSARA